MIRQQVVVRDGLHPDRPNENQGAESTLAFLQSLLELRLGQKILWSLMNHSQRTINLWNLSSFKHNPILTSANWPYQINSVFNPGATLLADGTTLLLFRVEDRRGLSHLCAARSANGIDNWVVDSKPTLPVTRHYPDELWA